MSAIQDALNRSKRKSFTGQEIAIIEIILGLLLIALLFWAGWNGGATEIIEALGGPDGNVSYAASLGVALFISLIYLCLKALAPDSN